MDPTSAARESAEAIGNLPAGFMLDGATYARGASLGFEGVDFYVAGRAGALGDVCGKVVAATFVFFNPVLVCEAWERTAKVMSRLDASREFARCLLSWADAHMPEDGADYERLAELAGRVAQSASPAGLALFSAWSELEEPSEPRQLALHRLNVLRELRGGLHGAAVVAAGLEPRAALMVRTPYMASLFGWSEPHPDPEPHRSKWEEVEAGTDHAVGQRLSVLTEDERAEFVELANAAYTAKA